MKDQCLREKGKGQDQNSGFASMGESCLGWVSVGMDNCVLVQDEKADPAYRGLRTYELIIRLLGFRDDHHFDSMLIAQSLHL